ncbi:hypothetical protein [Mariniblastus fucicola]|uniref:Uncharacterized protein n=1 Tax=Mariniblastus fucicola TaxID=980251 RepID=A0A5B9PFG4_9BACT|nr:hypothetical protein [Mariniblastus fucicola]QEG21633.1 hypothetical protein MFFC18_14910 [Mariniblastus fucicola]
MTSFNTIASVALFFILMFLQLANGQEGLPEGTIALPTVDSQGNVVTVSGITFDKEGARPSYELGLGSEVFGVRVSKGPSEVAPAPLINLMNHLSIKKELELTDEQQEAVSKIRLEGQKALRRCFETALS